MRILLSISLFIISNVVITAQTLKVHYKLSIESPVLLTPNVYDAVLLNNMEGTMLYTTVLNTTEKRIAKSGRHVVFKDEDFIYKLYKENDSFYIEDFLQNKKYYFHEDIPNIKYDFTDKTKEVNGVELQQAITHFRGRVYVIWYRKMDFTVAPWKFTDIPGIVYSAHSTDGKVKWEIQSSEVTNELIENPFPQSTEFLDYKLYPEKAYGLSEQLKKKLSMNPNNKMIEQDRNNLEIAFEWE